MCRDVFFFAYETYRFFYSYLLSRCAATYSQPLLQKRYFFRDDDDNQVLLFYPRQEYKQSCDNKSNLRFPDISEEEGRLVPPKYRET